MKRLQRRSEVAAPVIGLALSASAATSFALVAAVGLRSATAENVFVLSWLLGWVFLFWALAVSGGYAVLLGARAFSRRPVSPAEAGLAAAAVVVAAVVLLASGGLWGSGSGTGSAP